MPHAALAALVALIAMHAPAGAAGKAPTIDLAARSDTGSSSRDNVTSRTELDFSGTAAPHAKVTLKSAGTPIPASITANAEGKWFVTLYASSDGVFKLTAVAEGSTSEPLYLVVDTKKPIFRSLELLPSSDLGQSDSDGVTSSREPVFSGVTSEPVAQAILKAGKYHEITSDISSSSNRWTIAVEPPDFVEQIMSAHVVDLAGNKSETIEVDIQFDLDPPYSPSLRLLSSADPATGGIAPGTPARVGGLVASQSWNGGPDDSAVELSVVEETSTLSAGAVRGRQWRRTLGTLPLGIHTVRAVATDLAGNSTSSSAIEIKVLRQPRSLSVQSLSGKDGVRLVGPEGLDTGWNVAGVGDINADGIDDIAIGARKGLEAGLGWPGTIYIVFGRREKFPAEISLNALDGIDGFRIDGAIVNGVIGGVIAAVGDINGDGIDDVGFSAPYARAGGQQPGLSYVVYGRSGGFPQVLSADEIRGSQGLTLLGKELSGVGDVNGDGRADLAVRSNKIHNVAAPEIYLLYGPLAKSDEIIDPETDLSNKTSVLYEGGTYWAATMASNSGDINGDGINDVLLFDLHSDADRVDRKAFVIAIFGRAPRLPESIDASTIGGNAGLRIGGFTVSPQVGRHISLGDINGDGLDDAVFDICSDASSGFVVFGRRRFSSGEIDVAELDGRVGFAISVETASNDSSCRQDLVATAGDTNGDGTSDIVVGLPFSFSEGGKGGGVTYRLLSRRSGYTALQHVNLIDQARVRRFESATGTEFSASNAAAGDVNGDGYDDVIVGAPRAQNATEGGSAYVVFGRK